MANSNYSGPYAYYKIKSETSSVEKDIPMERMKFYTYDKILALAKKKTGVSTFLNDDEMFSKLTL